MKRKKTAQAALLIMLCLALSGCRIRTTLHGPSGTESPSGQAADLSVSFSGAAPGEDGKTIPPGEEDAGESGGATRENPEASRKEYDESRPAEILPGAEKTVHGGGEGVGLSVPADGAEQTADRLNSEAEKTAAQTVAADEAEQKGVSEDAEEADSAMTYYSVLLRDRMDSLFECQRLTVYWETKEDHVTVFKTSSEHSLILDAGTYDVSARLLESNLRVDDGWIGRKNPGIIVKVTDRSVLGTGVVSADNARRVYADLLKRDGWSALDAVRNSRVLLLSEELLEAPHLQLFAMLLIAKTANPNGFADVSPDEALAMLGEEAAGSIPSGIYYFNAQGGF